MTQPQDKMRAEFEVFTNTSPAVPDWARRDVFDPETPEYPGEYRDMYVQMMWDAWQAACAQQSAQSQQDALDAARWRKARTILAMTDIEEAELRSLAGIPEERESLRADEAIDALIATQGASNV